MTACIAHLYADEAVDVGPGAVPDREMRRATPPIHTAGVARFYRPWSERWRRIRDSNS
jgi:hypothetical protein